MARRTIRSASAFVFFVHNILLLETEHLEIFGNGSQSQGREEAQGADEQDHEDEQKYEQPAGCGAGAGRHLFFWTRLPAMARVAIMGTNRAKSMIAARLRLKNRVLAERPEKAERCPRRRSRRRGARKAVAPVFVRLAVTPAP